MHINYLSLLKGQFQKNCDNALYVSSFKQNPIITPALSETLSNNINGPSLIRVPDWMAGFVRLNHKKVPTISRFLSAISFTRW